MFFNKAGQKKTFSKKITSDIPIWKIPQALKYYHLNLLENFKIFENVNSVESRSFLVDYIFFRYYVLISVTVYHVLKFLQG